MRRRGRRKKKNRIGKMRRRGRRERRKGWIRKGKKEKEEEGGVG